MYENLTAKDKDFIWKVIEGEGLGYSLTDYFSSDISPYVNDAKLIELWRNASGPIMELRDYIMPLFDAIQEEEGAGEDL